MYGSWSFFLSIFLLGYFQASKRNIRELDLFLFTYPICEYCDECNKNQWEKSRIGSSQVGGS